MKEHPCYNGQWTVHEPHEYEVYPTGHLLVRGVAPTVKIKCLGKTKETVLTWKT